MTRIAIDAMGGDFAPAEIVKGAIQALAAHPDLHILLVGERDRLERELAGSVQRLELVHAPEVVGMAEAATAVRKKRQASINVAMDQVKSGAADGVVAIGSTGAAMASALLRLGRIPGIERPAIAAVLPTTRGPCILLDVGANVDSKPLYLQQWAMMGSVYAQQVLKIPEPRVALLNIGEEPEKGDELSLETFPLLQKTPAIRFIGNVEGRDVAKGGADVIVCDGFVGNVVLKTAEGFADMFVTLLKEEVFRGPLGIVGGLLLRPGLRRFRRRLDPSEYGGALLLGVNGVCVIGHGSSRAHAVMNAIRVAKEAVEGGALARIADNLQAIEA